MTHETDTERAAPAVISNIGTVKECQRLARIVEWDKRTKYTQCMSVQTLSPTPAPNKD